MWAAIKLFFLDNAAAIMAKAAMLFAAIGAVAAVYRAGAKSERNDQLEVDLENAKEALKQDAIIGGNSDVGGMRTKLSEALRRKRNS